MFFLLLQIHYRKSSKGKSELFVSKDKRKTPCSRGCSQRGSGRTRDSPCERKNCERKNCEEKFVRKIARGKIARGKL